MASGIQVYTRRSKKGTNNAADAVVVVTASPPATATVADASPPTTATSTVTVTPASPLTTSNNKLIAQKQKILSPVVEASDDSSSQNRQSEVVAAAPTDIRVGKPVVSVVDDRVKIDLKALKSKNEKKELSEKLKTELDQVRGLFQKLEDKKTELTSYSTVNGPAAAAAGGGGEAYSHSQYSGNDTSNKKALLRVNSEMGTDYIDRIDRRALMRANSEVGLVVNRNITPFRQLSVAVVDNSHGVGAFIGKEKRTPKANQYYRNSEFLLGKDRLPSNKRVKASGGWKHSKESSYGLNPEKHRNQVFKSCSSLLQRLMKHKLGWVFNEPVNANMLGLHDYHEVIKHPMDLGTIKSRLAQNFYKSPKEFAEDVRLAFRNAMTYNPEGQDVHTMAKQLSNIFEERWAVIESEYDPDRLEPVMLPLPLPLPKQNRTPALKKPKAKDPNKRNMTYEEKQKLGANLQSLPSEKLDNVVQIIKKKSLSLLQHNGELEVDIDSVDVETLWELDRFFINYKKSLSKRKRKAEVAQQGKAELDRIVSSCVGKADERTLDVVPLDEGDTRRDKNGSRSSSSSSSSTDSGSSSSDSDSDSSSADGSDAGRR